MLSNNSNRQRIAEIQDKDLKLTEVEIDTKNQTNLGNGVLVRVLKLFVDGQDIDDEILTVEIAIQIGDGAPRTLKFSGSERFTIQSREGDHIVEFGKQKVRFGLEMRNQQIAVMMTRI